MALNKNQKTNIGLVFASLASIVSGVLLHIAGHTGNHSVWELWAVVHSVVSMGFLVLIIEHLKQHKGWLASFRNKMRICTSQGRMFIVLSLFSMLTVCSGLVLLGIMNDHSLIGLWHYKIGIIFAGLAIAHMVRKHKVIRGK